ncbi:MAG: metallophosphoesterase family protein [Chloroflexi bacterium]|nr:metallophosphoesterase family protein [Chloroflexota bacterium]
MRILVISDIHGNLDALEAVLAASIPVDAVWCLGDLVGYGPDPNECITRIRSLPNLTCIMGNHDAAIGGNKNIDKFNDDAQRTIQISKNAISPENLVYLKRLREKVVTQLVTLTHGSPRNPVWEYLVDPFTAMMNFAFFNTQLAFVGHSHLPISFTIDPGGEKVHRIIQEGDQEMKITSRAILNPGSVGQPRDHDPRASFGIFDPEELTWNIHRVAYNIEAVQKRIIAAGLPERQAKRLTDGW